MDNIYFIFSYSFFIKQTNNKTKEEKYLRYYRLTYP
jgi:hypothetical protein